MNIHFNFKEDILQPLGTAKFWKELAIMTVGMFIAASSVYYFLMPSNLVIGSITGLSMVISSIFTAAGIPVKVSLVVTLINALLLVLAWLLIGAEFGAKTVYTALILGPFIEVWEKILPYQKLLEPGQTSVMGDPWFDLLCFVLVLSASQTILFNINASTGGLDILAKIVNKYLHFDIGTSVSVAGALICCTAFAVNPFRMVVIGLIGTWINGLALDYFTAGLNRRKRVCIISSRHEEIRKFIIEDLQRGCSLYEVTGGYNGHKNTEIQALLTQNEFADLMNYLKANDIHGFITAGNVSEIYGDWNSKKKKKK
ncbi:MAG: YitT family protein [Candidatus Cryptobacteroides sp.]|nr:YitT family protein [Candidatus Cryptobacteroides sp.]